MRLTCPNCGAQYEVGDDVIPDSGRDVQCSSCGNTWFQKSAKAKDEQAPAEPSDFDTSSEPEVTETDSPAEEPVAETVDETQGDESTTEIVEEPAPKSGLNEDVADILRSEAELETAQRAEENDSAGNFADPIENSISEGDTQIGEQVDVDMSDAATGARSDLLPDIEEINSTLSAEEAGAADAGAEELSVEASKSGFRRGFVIAVVIFAILALVYVFAREIADAIPQLASPLSTYVDWVNQLRESVDALMLQAVDKLTAILGQLNSDSAS